MLAPRYVRFSGNSCGIVPQRGHKCDKFFSVPPVPPCADILWVDFFQHFFALLVNTGKERRFLDSIHHFFYTPTKNRAFLLNQVM